MAVAEPSTMWSSLPAAQQLEVCAFLDPLSLGCLELCGSRQFEEARARAWKQAAETVPGTALAALSDKLMVAAHTRMRSLYPTSLQAGLLQLGDPYSPDVDGNSFFDEFAFTFAISWEDEDGCFRTAAFEHMNCAELPEFGALSELMYLASNDAPGQDTLAPPLLRAQEFARRNEYDDFPASWKPVANQYCTRKRDGVTIKMAEWAFIQEDINAAVIDMSQEIGSVSFEDGLLLLDHGVEDTQSTLHLLFDEASGHMRAFGSSHYTDQSGEPEPFPRGTIRALLHAKCEDANAEMGQ